MHNDIERLKYVLGLVDNLLKFAEAKHAALIALCGAAVWGVAGELCKRAAFTNGWKWLAISMALFLISMCISFKSFFPKTTPKKDNEGTSQNSVQANLYFFGHLACFSARDLRTAFKDRYDCDSNFSTSDEALDLCDQIAINAEITDKKFSLFKGAISFAGAGFILGCVVYAFQLGGTPCP